MIRPGRTRSSLRWLERIVSTPPLGVPLSEADRSAMRASGTSRARIAHRLRATSSDGAARRSAEKSPRVSRRIRPFLDGPRQSGGAGDVAEEHRSSAGRPRGGRVVWPSGCGRNTGEYHLSEKNIAESAGARRADRRERAGRSVHTLEAWRRHALTCPQVCPCPSTNKPICDARYDPRRNRR